MPQASTSQAVIHSVLESETLQGSRTSQMFAFAVYGENDYAKYSRSSQFALQGVIDQESLQGTRTTQALMQVVYGENVIERLNQRAWTFTLDGHTYYVLHLGARGTYVYDQSTSQWSQWNTDGFPNWNMELGWTFDTDRIIAGDNQQATIWRVDPNIFTDEGFRYIERRVTGALALRRRDTRKIYGLFVTASVGSPTTEDAYIRLRFSDDNGKNWSGWYTETLEPGDFQQVINLRSLGIARAPGRVFQIEDAGGVVRIDGADIDTDEG